MGEQSEHYTAAEIAPILRVGVYRATELCAEGKIPGAYKPAGRWLIHRETFDGWLAEERAKAADKAAS